MLIVMTWILAASSMIVDRGSFQLTAMRTLLACAEQGRE
jgi:hypothetical protein